MKFRIVTTFFIASLLSSCSSYTFKQMESFASKMTRFRPLTTDNYKLPQIAIAPTLIQKNRGHRGPASASKKPTIAKSFNNKRLYISTLLQQYHEMQAFTEESAPQISYCPHFHNTFIEMQEKGLLTPVAKSEFHKSYNQSSSNFMAHNPELSLPITYAENGPTVADMPQQQWDEYTQKAISIYIGKMHQEIHDLCYQGVTQSYYKFENMVTSSRITLAKPTLKNMQTLLKSPLYVNQLLIKSLQKGVVKGNHRTIASTHKKSSEQKVVSEVYQRFHTDWFKQYESQL